MRNIPHKIFLQLSVCIQVASQKVSAWDTHIWTRQMECRSTCLEKENGQLHLIIIIVSLTRTWPSMHQWLSLIDFGIRRHHVDCQTVCDKFMNEQCRNHMYFWMVIKSLLKWSIGNQAILPSQVDHMKQLLKYWVTDCQNWWTCSIKWIANGFS